VLQHPKLPGITQVSAVMCGALLLGMLVRQQGHEVHADAGRTVRRARRAYQTRTRVGATRITCG
jgi:hypothetical protein